MKSTRVEAFSDGVIAIIITIMVLELKPPHDATLGGLRPLIPIFLSYLLSFIYIGIYWNNHHHLFHAVERVHGPALWANLHLLFWLSLVPFTTGWMDENHFERVPVAVYGANLLGAAIAYFLLTRVLLSHHDKDSTLARALKDDLKGRISILIYIVAIVVAHWTAIGAISLYSVVAVMWLVPDRRIEKRLPDEVSDT